MLAILSVNHIIIDIRLINEGPQSCVTVDSRLVTCWGDDKRIPGRGTSWSSRRCPVSIFYGVFEFILARGLGVKVKGRVEKQDCNEQ